jgi:hypothetical protein
LPRDQPRPPTINSPPPPDPALLVIDPLEPPDGRHRRYRHRSRLRREPTRMSKLRHRRGASSPSKKLKKRPRPPIGLRLLDPSWGEPWRSVHLRSVVCRPPARYRSPFDHDRPQSAFPTEPSESRVGGLASACAVGKGARALGVGIPRCGPSVPFPWVDPWVAKPVFMPFPPDHGRFLLGHGHLRGCHFSLSPRSPAWGAALALPPQA